MNKKLSAAAIGAPVAAVIAWLVTLAGIEVPPAIAAAFGGICTFVASVAIPDAIEAD